MSTFLKGIAVSPGIIIGKSFVLDYPMRKAKPRDLSDKEVPNEVERFKNALEISIKQIANIREQVAEQIDETHAAIFDSHLMILKDPLIVEETIRRIREEKKNAEYIFENIIKEIEARFSKIQDEFFTARNSDIHDLAKKVMNNLTELDGFTLTNLKKESIVIAHDLGPSDTVRMDKKKVIAFVTDVGGPTSHTAIMAKALEIPAVVGLGTVANAASNDQTIIVDGRNGIVIIDPTDEEIQYYKKEKVEYEKLEVELSKLRHLPAETLDGYVINLCANIELPDEVPNMYIHGAEGIGLFRTEFLFLSNERLPSEEEQFKVYRSAVEGTRPHSVVFRTLDLGGDKFISSIPVSEELNPFLGRRAIRLCLEFPEILTTQLRAILRASAYGAVKIMFPLISRLDEVITAKQIAEEVKSDLRSKKIPFSEDVQIGIMIEVPSAAMIADNLATQVDFFSIGTNDLIQYTLAVDRVNEKVAYLYDPMHPSILRLIDRVVKAAHEKGVWVGVCGEMAGDPFSSIVLLGLGVDELSMGAVAIPEVKRSIRSIRLSDAKELVEEILSKSTGNEIKEIVSRRLAGLVKSFQINR